MKKILFPVLIAIMIWSCGPSKQVSDSLAKKVIITDSTEYEITIIDNEFNLWYQLNYSPAKDYTNEYYRSKNQIGVINWNDYYNRARHTRVIENYIYFEPSIDYGIEVNRQLFWYFKFIEDEYRIQLLHS